MKDKAQLDRLIKRAKREGWSEWIRGPIDHAAMLEWGCWFDVKAALRVKEFLYRFIRLADKGKQTRRFELMEWQWRDVVGPLFGWKRADGTRRFRMAWIEIGKKNGKSTLAAALVLLLAIADGEPEPEIYSAATTKAQAGLVFNEARKMVVKSPVLKRVVEVQRAVRRLVFPTSEGFYQVLAAAADSADGINASGVVFDEMHRQRNRELFDALMYAGAARRQPLFIVLTTAGNSHESIGWELHERAEKVATGALMDHEQLVYIATAPANDPIDAPATWRKANPSLGVTVQESDLAIEAERCKDSPARENNFRRLRLNQWVGASGAWLNYDRWAKCGLPVDPAKLAGRECYAGLDASSTNDFTALVLTFPGPDRTFDVLPFFWLPEDGLADKEKRAGVPLRAWAAKGLINLTAGDYIDNEAVRLTVNELRKKFTIRQLAYDPAYARDLAVRLQGDGLEVFEFWQSKRMTNPVLRLLERLVVEARVRHGNHPVLNWMASNARIKEDHNGLATLTKPKDSKKIDGISALSFSLGYTLKGEELKPYVGDNPELIVLG